MITLITIGTIILSTVAGYKPGSERVATVKAQRDMSHSLNSYCSIPEITLFVVPYIIPYITPFVVVSYRIPHITPFKEFRSWLKG